MTTTRMLAILFQFLFEFNFPKTHQHGINKPSQYNHATQNEQDAKQAQQKFKNRYHLFDAGALRNRQSQPSTSWQRCHRNHKENYDQDDITNPNKLQAGITAPCFPAHVYPVV